MTATNSLNINSSGVVAYNATTGVFSESTLTQHDVLVGGASNAITSVAPSATSGVALVSQGASSDPQFGTVVVAGGGTGAVTLTGVLTGNGTSAVTASTVTQHGVVIAGASNAVSSISPSTSGFVLTSNGASADPSFQAITASGAITTVDGDSGSMTPTSGVVTISGGTTGLTTTATASTMDVTGTLNAGHGGTGLATLTTYELVAAGTTATGNFQQIAAGSSGQILYSNGAGALPSFAAAPASISWVDVTTSTQTIAANKGYVTDNATQVTYTLPATPAFGDVFRVTGGVSGSATAPWFIAQNAGQQINFGNTSTTVGTGGSIASTLQYDSIECVCVVAGASAVWVAQSSVGNLIVT